MQITIEHDGGAVVIDPAKHTPQFALDEMLDTFTPAEIPGLLNGTLRMLTDVCDCWNQHELHERGR